MTSPKKLARLWSRDLETLLSSVRVSLCVCSPYVTSFGVQFLVHPGFLWVQSQSAGLLRPGTRGIATPESTSRLDDLDQMNLFKMSGFLPSSEPAIGRSQELATDDWCRRTAELPLLVELESAACPQKSRKDHFFLLAGTW